jgi:hypothetical protein
MNPVEMRGLNMAMLAAGLAAGTTTTLSTTATVPFCINGKAYSKTAITNGATPTTDAANSLAFRPVPANTGSVFVACFDASGNVKVCQGEVTNLDPASGLFTNAPEFPTIPDTLTPIGYIIIKAASTYVATTTGWLFGTHNLSAVTGITYTFVDVMTLPTRPQVS